MLTNNNKHFSQLKYLPHDIQGCVTLIRIWSCVTLDKQIQQNCQLTLFFVFFFSFSKAYHMSSCDDIRLFCNGYYAEIMVMDPFSLEVIFSLSSKVKPDWISALHVSEILFLSSVSEYFTLLHRFCDHRNVKTMWYWL